MQTLRSRWWAVCISAVGLTVGVAGCPFLAGTDSDSGNDMMSGGDAPAPRNAPPTAVATSDRTTVAPGGSVVFDGSRSFDFDGEIVAYLWDFGDGETSSLMDPTHVFDLILGDLTVRLTVTDDRGATAVDTLTIRVTNDAVERFALDVSVVPSGAGAVTLSPPGPDYDAGTLVTVTATPAAGFVFARFSGDVISEANEVVVTLTGDMAIVAEFDVADTFSVTVTVEPEGAGSVTLDPPGGMYGLNTSVTLTAQPNPGFNFDRYVDEMDDALGASAELVVDVTRDLVVTARFVSSGGGGGSPPPPTVLHALTVSVTPAGAGTVTLDPPGGSYAPGTVVTLAAAPVPGFAFAQYTGDASGMTPTTTVTMDDAKTVAAEFALDQQLGASGNLVVSGFVGGDVTEFGPVDGAALGLLVQDGAGGLTFAAGVDFGPDGDLFVVDVSTNSVLRFDGVTGASRGTFLTGPGLFGLTTLRFGPNGNLFVPHGPSDSVTEYDGATGAEVGAFVASGAGGLNNPRGLAFGPNGNLFVAAGANDAIFEYDGTTGDFVGVLADLTVVGAGNPFDVAFDASGDAFASVPGDQTVVRIDGTSGAVARFTPDDNPATPDVDESGGLDEPQGILFHPTTGHLLVVSRGTNSVLEYDGASGAFIGTFAVGTSNESFLMLAFRP